jgi:hypothetical protein
VAGPQGPGHVTIYNIPQGHDGWTLSRDPNGYTEDPAPVTRNSTGVFVHAIQGNDLSAITNQSEIIAETMGWNTPASDWPIGSESPDGTVPSPQQAGGYGNSLDLPIGAKCNTWGAFSHGFHTFRDVTPLSAIKNITRFIPDRDRLQWLSG